MSQPYYPTGREIAFANGRFLISHRLGNGSFGDIFEGYDTEQEIRVAVKLEKKKVRYPQLPYESKIYRYLHEFRESRPQTPNSKAFTPYSQRTDPTRASEHNTEVHTRASNSNPTHESHSQLPPNGECHVVQSEVSNSNNKIITTADTSSNGNNNNNKIWGMPANHLSLEHLKHPHQLIQRSRSHQVVGIPKIYFSGYEGDYNIMVMELCGPSLEDLLNYCHRRFSLKTVLMIADQILHRMEFFHDKGFIHRDIKPENFVYGDGAKGHILYVIDFGLSKMYWDHRKNVHMPFAQNKPLTGTARYCSINTHKGFEQSRRDDLESIGFLFIYFLKGSLPWQGIPVKDQQLKTIKIGEKKMSVPLETLCADLPHEFLLYSQYCRQLTFQERPDYEYLRNLFRSLGKRCGFTTESKIDNGPAIKPTSILQHNFNAHHMSYNTHYNNYNNSSNSINKTDNNNIIGSADANNNRDEEEDNDRTDINQQNQANKRDIPLYRRSCDYNRILHNNNNNNIINNNNSTSNNNARCNEQTNKFSSTSRPPINVSSSRKGRFDENYSLSMTIDDLKNELSRRGNHHRYGNLDEEGNHAGSNVNVNNNNNYSNINMSKEHDNVRLSKMLENEAKQKANKLDWRRNLNMISTLDVSRNVDASMQVLGAAMQNDGNSFNVSLQSSTSHSRSVPQTIACAFEAENNYDLAVGFYDWEYDWFNKREQELSGKKASDREAKSTSNNYTSNGDKSKV